MTQIMQGKSCNLANYSSRGSSKIEYIVIHYTAGDGDTAEGNCSYFANGSRGASAHYFVGDDGIFQSVPDDMKAWHCGGANVYKHPYCRNSNSLGIEMCSRKNAAGEYYINNSVVEKTIELTKYLMRKYVINDRNVLRHFDVWDKTCPAPFVIHPGQWILFKNKITVTETEVYAMTSAEKTDYAATKAQLALMVAKVDELKHKVDDKMIYNYIDDNMPEWARPTIMRLVDRGFLHGNERGELQLTDELLRMLVINDRAGLYK